MQDKERIGTRTDLWEHLHSLGIGRRIDRRRNATVSKETINPGAKF